MTLVELILYLALFSVIILSMVQFFVFVSNKNVDARNRIELSRNVIFVREHFTQVERSITGFNDGSSVYDSDSGRVVFTTSNGDVSYTRSGGDIIYNRGTDITLTPDGVVVQKFRATKHVDTDSNTVGVTISITLGHSNVVGYTESFEFLVQDK